MLAKLKGRFGPRAAAATPAPAEAPAAPDPALQQLADFKRTMVRDEVTGLPNRAQFIHILAQESETAARTGTELSVLVVDWPGYRFTTTPGLRDRRLAGIAARIGEALNRKHDAIARIGEGRLAVVLPFTDAPGADRVGRKIQDAAQEALLTEPPRAHAVPAFEDEAPSRNFGRGLSDDDDEVADGDKIGWQDANVSIGLSSYCGKGPLTDDALLKAAEQAASFASMNGGNQIVRCDAGEIL
jgi:diguanylate cyclase (GGDEF)-like protein